MLQMGFQEPVEEIFKEMPENKQTTLWSATMPGMLAALSNVVIWVYSTPPTLISGDNYGVSPGMFFVSPCLFFIFSYEFRRS